MKSLLSRIGERLALFGAVLGMMTAGQVSSVAQSFTSPGGIGFSIAPGNYTAVLGSTNYLPVTLHYTNDVLNDYDGDSADGSYGCIDGFYDTLYEYEILSTSHTYWTTNVDYGDYEYENYANDRTYWTNTYLGYCQYVNPITSSSWWTNTCPGDYEYQEWNGTEWEDEWYDDYPGGVYCYEEWNGSEWTYIWTNSNFGLYQYVNPWTSAAYWTNTDSGLYQYQEYSATGTPTGTTWTGTWNGACLYSTGSGSYWTNTYSGNFEYAEYDTDGDFLGDVWVDEYPGGEYYYETYYWDGEEWVDLGGNWTDTWSGLDYEDGDYYYCCLDKWVAALDQKVIAEFNGQQVAKELAELNQEMIEEQIDAETMYLYFAPWFVYTDSELTAEDRAAETTIKLSDNAGNSNVEYGTMTFVPLTDTMSVPLSYVDNEEAWPDIVGTLTVEDTDPNPGDVYYLNCYPDYIYSAINASASASYTFLNPYTDMYATVDGGAQQYSEVYVVETNAAQSVPFRVSRTDTYNARSVYYTITAAALNSPNDTMTFSNSVAFAASGAEYVDIPVTNYFAGVSGPVSVTLTLDYAPNYDSDPYEVDADNYSALIWFMPEPSVNITVNGGSSASVTESETPQSIPLELSASNLWLNTTVNYTVSGTAQNGGAYSAPWSGSSGSVTLTGNGSGNGSTAIPVTSGANLSTSQTLTVSLAGNPGSYLVGTPSSVTITFLPNTSNPAATDTGTADPGSGQTFRPLPVSYNNANVSGLKNGPGTSVLSNTVSGLPVALVNVQTLSPYATAAGPTPGVFSITSSGRTNAFTVNYTVTGTASPGVNYTALSGSVQFAANQTSTNLTVNLLTNVALSSAQTVVLTLNPGANYYLGYNAQAVVTLLPNSSLTNSVAAPSGRYWRGSGNDPTYWSQVIPLDYETGTVYSNLSGNCSNLYSGLSSWSSQTLYHYNAAAGLPQTNTANRIAFNNPIVAFGERIGGTPLYFGQPYGLGICAGDPLLSAAQIVIQAYYRTNDQLAGSISVVPPNYFSTNSMVSYATNGFQVTTNAFGLSTTLSDSPGLNWGATSLGAYVLTHTATTLASNYYYLVEASGYPAAGSNAMVINAGGAIAPSLLYTLEFEARPPWRSIFLDQPQFTGYPMPPVYAGETVAEMMTNTPPVTNIVNFTPSAATNLDDSPELKRHPILDSFVASMGNDPIALANYVINQIDLTDPMDYSDNGNLAEQAINPGGVSRGALGTFMEKQGSAADQCALLVYLLRQAGVPTVYEFAPRNGLQILDARLSQMLKFQIQGAVNEAGQLYTTNAMIAVNYPWVAAYTGTNWVHIFPWLKDYEITEGFNLYDYMPTNYSSAYPWVRDYICGSTNLLALAANGDNTPSVILPAYLQQTLQQNYPGVSVSDLGVQILHRQHYYARWQDFPTPTWVTNVSTPLESLTSSGITNISPTLTNIFDTVSVEVYSQANPTNNIQTGNLRLVDLHNREFYIYQTTNAGNLVQLSLILLPFRTNVTTQFAYTNDPTLLSREVLTMNLGTNEMYLGVRFAYQRHRALSAAYPIDPSQAFLGYAGCDTVNLERPLLKGDQAAICLDYGRVTPEMLGVYAGNLWQMQSALQANPSLTNSISPDLYEGAVMYLAGMSYYKNVSDFNVVNQNLHKVCLLSTWAAGLSKLGAARDGFGYLTNGLVIPVLPSVDMFYYETAMVGNGTVQPDSGQTAEMAQQNYNLIAIVNNSAEEHQIINNYYQQTNAVSTVRLLQLSQSQAGGMVPLNYNNYLSQGQVSYQGQPLQNWDAGLWAQVANALQNSPYTLAYLTPGPVTNSAYAGMGALILGWNQWHALISPESLNGATGTPLPLNSVSAGNTGKYGLAPGAPYQFTFTTPLPDTALAPTTASVDAPPGLLAALQNGQYAFSPFNTLWASQSSALFGLPASGTPAQNYALTYQYCQLFGGLGPVTDGGEDFLDRIADPVNSMTGEFYVNETDLLLPGPLPLALRRNYSSQNLADNQFGAGWKLNIMPYLVMAGGTNIYAADMDGAVLAYVQTATNADVWIPTLAANPLLDNNTTAGVGGLANRLRDRIVQTVTGGTTNYTLYGADGSIRVFQVTSFNNGVLNQTRPYLQTWTDSRGNYYTFAYGTNAAQPNFGQVIRIQASNGNFLGFDFDVNAHIIDAYTGDGRWLYYAYDDYGDLVTVTLPDATTRSYVYQHAAQAVTNSTVVYSTHLIIEEDKPDGRVLQNAYDGQRRVTNQWSTAGANLVPVRAASFVFSNNFALTNSYTNSISGYTLIIDGNGNTNRYDYTNSLFIKTTDPLGQTVQQTWYPDNAVAPGYPRSVATRIDKRGLLTQFSYDSNGNVTNTIVTGNLTADGILNQTATNTAVYNANCLPVQMTDPAGNSMVFVYDPTFTFLPQQITRYAGATPVSTTFIVYGSVTNVVAEGSTTQTNLALGLAVRQIRAYGSPDAATTDTAYNGQGFPIQTVRYTGTSDPAITNTFFYNERGQMVDQVDSLGAVTYREYDAMDRPTEQECVDENGVTLSLNEFYYNENGELAWQDGPAYNPDDYVWFDYDGAGRLSTEIHWRAEANPNGTGVQAPAGYNLYAQTFYMHDVLGNLTWSVNPRGVITTNTWDALNRLVSRSVIDTNGSILTTEGFGYEPGGLVRFDTNGLGGFTHTEYTTTGKPEYRANADSSTNGWRYYLDGRVRQEIQRNGAYWQITYNDANLTTTRVFYSAVGVPLATNSTTLDRRGNVIQRVDAAFNVFTSSFDGLDRLKVSAGPATTTVTENCGGLPGCGVYVTNILQQVTTRTYDAANRVLTVSDALGEKTVTTSDMLGRVLSMQTFAAGATTPLRVTSYAYSADHHSVTVTEGSGPEAVVTTTFTDNDGRKLLTIKYPSAGASEFTLNQYDLAGNLIHEEHDSGTGGTPNVWAKADYTFDGLNRMISKSDRDGALTTFAYDAANDPTSRLMPSGLLWSATYNNAGQELQDWVSANGDVTQSNSYSYYPSGAAAVGLQQTKTDGAGVISTFLYDDWLRLTNATRQQPSIEPLVTSWGYDVRGLATNITEENHTWAYDPGPIVVQRTFDAYGQITSETVTVNSSTESSATQGWDVAGRRTLLSLSSQVAGMSYGYSWRADGLLGAVSTSAGAASYTYSTGGLLDNRSVVNRATTVTSRDGAGRPLTISTTVNAQQDLAETLTWTGDGLLSAHVLSRTDFTDQRSYSYASLSRRLTTEQMNLDATHCWTNDFVYDSGIGAGLGLLTYAGAPNSTAAAWNGAISPLCRINRETNTVWRETAYGRLNGAATVSAFLDGHPLPVSISPTLDYSWTNRWSTTMELTPGTHQLTVSALHPSGLFTTNATAWFTNNVGQQTDQIYRDGAGHITQRSYTSADGTANHTQALSWDFKGRLCNVLDCNAQGNGFFWIVEYDGLDRLLCTEWYAVTNGEGCWWISGQTNSFVYDPQAQFLDLGVYASPSGQDSLPGQMTWKLCGPDLNGRYGGMNGVGGLEATATGVGYFSPTVSDARGNILGACDPEHGTVAWSPSRPSGYGAVPGYRPLPLGHGGSYAQSAAWRGKWADVTGYVWIGARFYDPVAGMWLSPDPGWNSQDPSYWSFCGGDPINHFDPSGLCVEKEFSAVGDYLYSGGSYGQEYRNISGILNSFGDSTTSPTLGALAAFGSYFTDRAANNVTPSYYVNQASSDYNAAGGGVLGVLGVGNRYNPTAPAYDFFSGIDLINGQQLSGVDRASAGLNTLGGALLLTASIADSFTPGTTPPAATPTAPSVLSTPEVPASVPISSEIPAWRQYELQNGSQQTTMQTTFNGQQVTVRLDNPPTGSQIIDFKDYDWSNPSYQKPFIQQQVINDFQTQIQKYQTIAPNVNLQFSQEPPVWVADAIKQVGGTYSVKP